MRLVITPSVALTWALVLGGCGGGDNFTPTAESVAGSYVAASFSATSAAGTTDLLASGATVEIDLASDGTTTGRLFVPGGAEDGGDLDEDLEGTWILTGSTVTFNQTAHTFIRDVDFTAGPDRLSSEGTFDDVTVRLALIKTD